MKKRMRHFGFMFIGLLVILSALNILSAPLQAAVPAGERAALIALYNTTNGDSWTDNSGWKTPPLDTDGFAMPGTEGTWYGITVSDVSGDHVTTIDMGYLGNNLNGTIPAELGNLSSLEYLELPLNQLSGSIPPELGNLTQLKILNFYSNQLTGSIPSELGSLSNLEWLNLYVNQLSGSIPSELGSLSNLDRLYLASNQLSGSIPSELGNLSSLTFLWLFNNQLSGSIPPELGNLSNLTNFSMSSNQLSGSIPPELGNPGNLTLLILHHNDLSGSIPAELGNLSNLGQLMLNANQLNGSIPAELGNLSNLSNLNLGENQLSGSIPAELGNLNQLISFYLNSNRLTGSIPSTLVNLTALYSNWTDIGYNGLYTDDGALQLFLDSKDADWAQTQTTAPTNVSAATLSSYSIRVSWAPITYTGDTGGYLVYYSTTSGGPWTYAGVTADKLADSYDVTGLNGGTTYYFVVKTRTDSHGNNANTVTSEYSEEASAATDPIGAPYSIVLNRTELNFGYVIGGNVPGSQMVYIKSSNGALNWTADTYFSWLNVSPLSGIGPGVITVSVDPSALAAGTYTGAVTVSDPNATNSPQTVNVTLKIYPADGTSEPFGEFSTPLHQAVVNSSIPVTGWALDDVGVESVKIYREVEGSGTLAYIGDAVFVEGARPDVELAFPDYPMNYRAGWGYMMLTNFLPNGGNGTYTLHAIATDVEGHQVTLGTKTITCDNANAVKPFGAIDTPTQGGTVSGSNYRNHGWVLTPPPNSIPTDGSTIDIYIDGVNMGHPIYNIYRADVAGLFPGYANSNGAHAYFDFDTTAYENGVHTIYWTATDSANNTDGIGSRYFTIQNSSGSRVQGAEWHGAGSREQGVGLHGAADASMEPVGVVKGYRKDVESREIYPDDKGIINIQIKQLERIELHLFDGLVRRKAAGGLAPLSIVGYQLVGDQFRSLPIGSTLDTRSGIFYWHVSPAFFDTFHLVFVTEDPHGRRLQKRVCVTIIH